MNSDMHKILPKLPLQVLAVVPIDEAGNSEKWTCTDRGNTHNTFSSFFVIVFALELRVIVASLFVSLHFFSEFHFFFTFIVCAFVPYVHYTPCFGVQIVF